jgi:hypothetical protein
LTCLFASAAYSFVFQALQPGLRKGSWTVEEDMELLTWAEAYIKNKTVHWNEMAQMIPNRTDVQVRQTCSGTLQVNSRLMYPRSLPA